MICHFVIRLLCDALIFPLQERLDDWKKSVVQMDKDHAKGGRIYQLQPKLLLVLLLKIRSKHRDIPLNPQKFSATYSGSVIVIISHFLSTEYRRLFWRKYFTLDLHPKTGIVLILLCLPITYPGYQRFRSSHMQQDRPEAGCRWLLAGETSGEAVRKNLWATARVTIET